MKANYDSDDAWKQALSSAGLTEDQYRESVEAGLLDKALEDAVLEMQPLLMILKF